MSTQSPSVQSPNEHTAGQNLRLPPAALPKYGYDSVMTWGDIAFVSGQIPRDGQQITRGVLGEDRSIEQAISATRLCALNALAQLDRVVGLSRVAQVLKMTVYVASGSDVVDQPTAAEGATVALREMLGESGRHARTTIGVRRLPANALAEVDLIVGLKPQGAATA